MKKSGLKYFFLLIVITVGGVLYSYLNDQVDSWNKSEESSLKNGFIKYYFENKENSNPLDVQNVNLKDYYTLSIFNIEHWRFLNSINKMQSICVLPIEDYQENFEQKFGIDNWYNKNLFFIDNIPNLDLIKYSQAIKSLAILNTNVSSYSKINELDSLRTLRISDSDILLKNNIIDEIQKINGLKSLSIWSLTDSLELDNIEIVNHGDGIDTIIPNRYFFEKMVAIVRDKKVDFLNLKNLLTKYQCQSLKELGLIYGRSVEVDCDPVIPYIDE